MIVSCNAINLVFFVQPLLFIALSDAELAKERVPLRVSQGGHDVPDDVIERRFHLGLTNFFELYSPIVGEWIFAENTINGLTKIAEESPDDGMLIFDKVRWTCYREMVKS